jgi:small-conductance mechanosensitive channel
MLRLDDMIQFSGVKGRVVRIGLVTTWLKTDDGTIATVTNSNLLAGPMLNYSAQARLDHED